MFIFFLLDQFFTFSGKKTCLLSRKKFFFQNYIPINLSLTQSTPCVTPSVNFLLTISVWKVVTILSGSALGVRFLGNNFWHLALSLPRTQESSRSKRNWWWHNFPPTLPDRENSDLNVLIDDFIRLIWDNQIQVTVQQSDKGIAITGLCTGCLISGLAVGGASGGLSKVIIL